MTKAAENLTINYRYDAAGNRVAKIVDKDGEVTTNRYIRDASGNVMAVYQDTLTLEHHIYGSSRLGLALEKSRPGQLKLGHRQYELSNHLGNVLAVITDNVNMTSDTQNSEWYESKAWPTLVKTNDYYPFGLAMGGRTSEFSENDSVAYRYGFNGKEKDVEGMGGGGSTYDYGFRIYNPRIAKFLSVDPLTSEYPWYTPYQFAGNKPIMAIDIDGLEEKAAIYLYGEDKPALVVENSLFTNEPAMDVFYDMFTQQADLMENFKYHWEKGYKEYSENGGPNSFGTLEIREDMGGTFNLSYNPASANPVASIGEGFKSGWGYLSADTRGNRIGKRMTIGIATAPLAAGTSVLAGLEMIILLNEVGSSGAAAANGELESSFSALRSLITEYAGETGGEYYDYAETTIKGIRLGISIRDVKNIKTWEDTLDEGVKAIAAEIDSFIDYYKKYYESDENQNNKESVDN
ncbi:RHS repeat-associated core domain-containing protein [Marivirga tractuosa]|uniref:RHS repeat domain-containing protein n=1 Tax=Marivirga tractuosa TaxID=1006 RepID=UPI0035D0209D